MTGAGHEAIIRAAAIYLPIAAVVTLGATQRVDRRRLAAAVVATTWNLVALLVVNVIAIEAGWWHFEGTSAAVAGVPVEMWLGWTLLWGAVPALVPVRPAAVGVIAVVLDLVLMPLAHPVVTLSPSWLVGEAVAVSVALGPGMVLAHLTVTGRRPAWRAGLQLVAFAGINAYLFPTLVFVVSGHDWSTLLSRSRGYLIVATVVAAAPAAMAIQAVREMVIAGGTPVPLDPPRRLVTTGPYAYVANPMQCGATVLLALWGVVLGDPAVMATAAGGALFSAGFARWQENGDLLRRYGDEWLAYRREVRCWVPRWRPHRTSEAQLATARTCDPCREVGFAFIGWPTVGLRSIAAEEITPTPLRATYLDGEIHDTGLAAIGRALEHVNFLAAVVGWLLRLPMVAPVLQLIADASGAGPREIESWNTPTASAGSPRTGRDGPT